MMIKRSSILLIAVAALTFTFLPVNNFTSVAAKAAFNFGDPVPGVDVSVEQSPSGYKASATTDDKGVASFANIKPGLYRCERKGRGVATGTRGGAFLIVAQASGGSKATWKWDVTKSETFSGQITIAGDAEKTQTLKITITKAK